MCCFLSIAGIYTLIVKWTLCALKEVSETYKFLFAELDISNLSDDCRTRVTVHAVQLMPQKPYRAHESYSTLSLEPEQKDSMILPVVVRCNTLNTALCW